MEPADNLPDTLVERPVATPADSEQVRPEHFLDFLERDEIDSALDTLQRMYPADQGLSLIDLDRAKRSRVLGLLEPSHTAHIPEHLSPQEVAQVADGVDSGILSSILDVSSTDVAADVLRHLSRPQADEVQANMLHPEAVQSLLQYPDSSAREPHDH